VREAVSLFTVRARESKPTVPNRLTKEGQPKSDWPSFSQALDRAGSRPHQGVNVTSTACEVFSARMQTASGLSR
jgi:hypothetical protein